MYKIITNEICDKEGKVVLRDNRGEHIILTNGIEDNPEFCCCEDIN